MPVTVVILTFNEEANLAACLESCRWSDDVHILDSGSTDRTADVAREHGIRFHVHSFQSFGNQRNWAIDHIAHKYDWVFHLDADERFTPDLVAEIANILSKQPTHAGYFVPHKLIFMGRWLRFAEGRYPVYQMRLFHRDRARFRDFGHGQREETSGSLGRLKMPYLHFSFAKGIEDWIDKHNRYSTLEARQIAAGQNLDPGNSKLMGTALERRRFFKSRVYPRVPAKWFWRFIWMYLMNFGFLDGSAGLQYCLLMSAYELYTGLKLVELRGSLKTRTT